MSQARLRAVVVWFSAARGVVADFSPVDLAALVRNIRILISFQKLGEHSAPSRDPGMFLTSRSQDGQALGASIDRAAIPLRSRCDPVAIF